MHKQFAAVILLTVTPLMIGQPVKQPNVAVAGELKRWHKVTLTLDGPATSATATPNPAAPAISSRFLRPWTSASMGSATGVTVDRRQAITASMRSSVADTRPNSASAFMTASILLRYAPHPPHFLA